MNAENLVQRLRNDRAWPLFGTISTRAIEVHAQGNLPSNTLMQRAGLATAQLAMALTPHAQTIWIACGPGNNGGDGLEAAMHLKRWGKRAVVTWLGTPELTPPDAQQAWQRACASGVVVENAPPAQFDLAIDALLGMGCQRKPDGSIAQWLTLMHASESPILSVDVPSGLMSETGQWFKPNTPTFNNAQRHTLSLLTLKPGLFTADGRDAAGEVWFCNLGIESMQKPDAWLQAGTATSTPRPQNSHKGSYGDVMVIGGAPGMTGAAVLASTAALHGGAGRVLTAFLDDADHSAVAAQHPALMVRQVKDLAFEHATIVCGCGGGDAVRTELPRVLSTAARLVLDADALNAIARDPSLLKLLKNRAAKNLPTVLTPHPLEAARMLGCTAAEVQMDRLEAAEKLAQHTQSVVVLKGSGSIIAQSGETSVINPTGSALLATAGTGDVLAGLIGAKLAQGQNQGQKAFSASCEAVRTHGFVADTWGTKGPTFDAALLAASVR
ncbi:NAD(P)H-hydrate dehydratase [Limnohabitans sp. B9-3]|uniref:NAD(P)H-hydrate dehydratase n=1 Tax=Limnohabitans sp. B9-3 TaxID=1100707 RepID=UPI000C1EC7EB|nr:NAD(P)H-hydrate dehydratase [Limnohabitans sp. B9-3]